MRAIVCIIGLILFTFILIPINLEAQSVEGYVTHGLTGDPLENAQISYMLYTTYTGPDGYYLLEGLLPGTYILTCIYGDLCPFDTTLNINGDIELDIQLYPCQELIVEPLNIVEVLAPNAQSTSIIAISNPEVANVEWTANLEIFPPGKDFLDVQFQYSVAGPISHVGIECDGEYFYTTDPYSGIISKYNLDGTFVEDFSMITGLQDLAFDGTYFYGGNGSITIYQMDFYAQALVGTFTAPQNVKAIAYNDDEDIFYGYSWGGDIIAFDLSGALIGSAPVGPSAANYSGFAYDNVSDGSPYLWGYGLVGTDPNTLVQMELPGLQETGFALSLGSILPEPFTNGAGGLFTHPDIFPGTWTLGGMIMDEWIWGLELAEEEQTWVSIEPTSGVLEPGESEEMIVYFDATDVYPWSYDAEILFNTMPNAGSPVVEITMMIEGEPGIHSLQAEINCTNIILSWETIPPGTTVDSFYVYKDSIRLATTFETTFVDSLLFPEIEHTYYTTAYFFNGWESDPTNTVDVMVPFPANLEPTNLSFTINDSLILLSWDPPAGCLTPDAYNIFRDGNLLTTSIEPNFTLNNGSYSFFVTALYYFGESGPSNSITITGIKEIVENQIQLSPNPANDVLVIQSPVEINYLELLNIQGSISFSENVRSKDTQLDISNLKPGVYFLKLKTAEEIISKKVMIK